MFDTLTDYIGATGWSVLGGVVLAAYSTIGLLAVWCAWGRPYWFARIAVLGVVLAPLLIVPAHELVVIFFVQSVVTIVPLLLMRRRLVDEKRAKLDIASECMLKAPPGATLLQRSVLVEAAQTEKAAAETPAAEPPPAPARRKFTWRDAALLAVVAAVIGVAAAVVAGTTWPNPEKIQELPLLGVCFGAFTLIAVALVFAEVSLQLRLLLCLVLPPLPMIGWVMFTLGQVVEFPAAIDDIPLWSRLLICFVFPWLPMLVWLALARVAGFPAQVAATRPIVKRLAQVALAAVSLAILLPTLAASYDLVVPAPIPKEPLPEPNGYDTLLRAGRTLKDVTIPRGGIAAYGAFRAFIQKHEDVFRATRAALKDECVVPVQYTSFEAPFEGRRPIQQLGRAILTKGNLAELEGHNGDAAQSYLDAVRLGDTVARSGMFIDQLAGWKVQNIAIRELYGLRKWLTEDECRRLVDDLLALDADADANTDADDIRKSNARERAWCDRSRGWQGRLNATLHLLEGIWGNAVEIVERAGGYRRARLRLLICDLAMRRYRAKHDRWPTSLAELVGDDLPAVPADPFTGKPLIYVSDPANRRLYSIGPDGRDDGGKPLNFENWSGDIRLDARGEGPL